MGVYTDKPRRCGPVQLGVVGQRAVECVQDKCRVSGAKEKRQIFVFEKALLITKQKPDDMLSVKAFISVRIFETSAQIVKTFPGGYTPGVAPRIRGQRSQAPKGESY